MNFSVLLELTLVVLLMVTLAYCVVLERKLAGVKKGQQALGRTVHDLNVAIEKAGVALSALKAATSGVGEDLNDRIHRGRALADELSLLTASGERIAERFDRAVATRPAPADAPPSAESIMGRLDALRTVR
jgi:hypothetical protein